MTGFAPRADAVERDGKGSALTGLDLATPISTARPQPDDGLEEVIAHLTLFIDGLNPLPAADVARWMATNDAGHSLHRALIELREATVTPTGRT